MIIVREYIRLILFLALLIFLPSTPAPADPSSESETIRLTKNDYLTLIVGNYVHGFKEFETSVTASDGTVNITIFYSNFLDNEGRVFWLADLFQLKIPEILKQYSWAKDVTINVEVYPERRAGGGLLKKT